jgi:hypothetical protein
MEELLFPGAEEFQSGIPGGDFKSAGGRITFGILNNGWLSMSVMEAVADERLRRESATEDVLHWKMPHSRPTPALVLDEVGAKAHLVVIGIGN